MSGLPPSDYNYPSAGQGTIEKNLIKLSRIVFQSLVPNLGQNLCQPNGKKHILENIFLTVTKIQTFDNQTLILDLHDCQNLENPSDFFQSSV